MRYSKGKLYRVKFYDHCINSNNGEPMTCEVVGFLIDSKKDYIVLSHWVTHTKCEETFKSNLELTTILKKVIINAELIK